MPLPPPQARTPMHNRRVHYQGFRRDDGLWDIEGELHDSKPHDIDLKAGEHIPAGEPIHHMRLRVTFDESMVIRDIAVAMDAFPHDPCPQAMPPMQGMVGEVLGRGWRHTIQRHLGGIQGCTHLRELLFNLATAAFQTRTGVFSPSTDGRPPAHLGQCVGWDFNGPVVETVYPMFFRWQPPARDTAA
ncbi:MAG: DUF2889 domain-containing protein [Hydrogenophaga sp.]|nr:DUF2889 domain-containing protein [Hydrogenophaga sp.]